MCLDRIFSQRRTITRCTHRCGQARASTSQTIAFMNSFLRSGRLAADQVDAELLRRIANIGEESANNSPDTASSITFLRETSSQHSQVSTYRIETLSGPRYVVAKRIRDPKPGTVDFLQREYDALQKIREVAGDSLADTLPNALLFSQQRIVLSMVACVSPDRHL